MTDPDPRDELRRLIDTGVKLSRLTVTTVVCEHGGTLASVYRVNGRHLVDVRLTQTATIGDAQEQDTTMTMLRRGEGRSIRVLDDLDDDAVANVSTDCCTRRFTAGWLREQVEGGVRRSVLSLNAGTL